MKASQRIIGMVARLWNLTTSSREHEAAAARERAISLMQQHRIQRSDIIGSGVLRDDVLNIPDFAYVDIDEGGEEVVVTEPAHEIGLHRGFHWMSRDGPVRIIDMDEAQLRSTVSWIKNKLAKDGARMGFSQRLRLQISLSYMEEEMQIRGLGVERPVKIKIVKKGTGSNDRRRTY